jgi:hypothetical protein
MYEHDEFLWSGLRARLERMGRVRPRTIRLEAVGQLPEHRHPQVRFRPTDPALRPRVQSVELVRR